MSRRHGSRVSVAFRFSENGDEQAPASAVGSVVRTSIAMEATIDPDGTGRFDISHAVGEVAFSE